MWQVFFFMYRFNANIKKLIVPNYKNNFKLLSHKYDDEVQILKIKYNSLIKPLNSHERLYDKKFICRNFVNVLLK